MPPHGRQLGLKAPDLSAAWRRRPMPARPGWAILAGRSVSNAAAAAERSSSSGHPLPETDWNQFISVGTFFCLSVFLPVTAYAFSFQPLMRAVADPDASRDAAAATGTFTLAVKDNIATTGSGLTTTCASGMLAGYVSPFEATIVGQLRTRGAVVVGKTNMDEFGMGSHSVYSHAGRVAADTTRQADDALSVGGSSGGSAVAVRLGDVDVALGTDTGGSVRLPAAYGGIVGFKPSYGMLSRFGVVPYANSLDTVGLLATDVGPIQRLIVGEPGGLWQEADTGCDPTSLSRSTRLRLAAQRQGYGGRQEEQGNRDVSQPLLGLSFGIPLEYNIAELDPRIRAAWTAAATRLRLLGASVAAVSLPSTRHALSAYYVIAPAEAASNLARYDGVRYGGKSGRSGQTGQNKRQNDSPSDSQNDDNNNEDPVLYQHVRGAGLGPEAQQRILLGAYALSSAARDNYFLQAQRVRRLVVRDFDAVFRLANPLRDPDAEAGTTETNAGAINLSDLPEGLPLADRRGPAQVDFLLCPTAPTPAPRLANVVAAPSHVDAYMNDVFTVPASLAGLPAISIPAPSTATTSFCPGLQLVGQFWDDARLLRVAETLMEAAFELPEDREALQRHRWTGVAEA
ncbi:glutamyl-tRNA amidotransferase [Grosmannia clavigera kw1407]|uniref:Glutamyl-tRNA(Gln) amidotransferase subunit A, mitochondrial n=1 Tax=Grosmannia clavigera (strain kw1407 / UAMH 11150) TaxID=655863 RepID=F0XUN6_GROCL|nr:glutamyl-tRNA amidotransferase [Grosmannia clavigera kw1407]EFW98592.1 glutamyl-tRNA amidotransferase [Grosmannia clavigera kw1407]